MRVQLHPDTSPTLQVALRTIAIAFLLTSLMIGAAWPMSASGHVASSAAAEAPVQRPDSTSPGAA